MQHLLRFIRGAFRKRLADNYQTFQYVPDKFVMNKCVFKTQLSSSDYAVRDNQTVLIRMIIAWEYCLFIRRAILGRYRIFKKCKVCLFGHKARKCAKCNNMRFTKPVLTTAAVRLAILNKMKKKIKDPVTKHRIQMVMHSLQHPRSIPVSCYKTRDKKEQQKNAHPASFSRATQVLMSVVCDLELEIVHMMNAWSALMGEHAMLWEIKPSDRQKFAKKVLMFHARRKFPHLSAANLEALFQQF